MINLNEKSQSIKKDASEILKKTRLLETLSKYGKVFIRGSYALDLMLDGDIDIYVINDKLDKNLTIKALNELLVQNNFQGYWYYDYVQRRLDFFPLGYYIGLKTEFNKRRWKVDIWFIKETHGSSEELFNYVKDNLNNETKKIILELKDFSKSNNLNILSHEIYLDVIKDKVSSIDELLKKHNKI